MRDGYFNLSDNFACGHTHTQSSFFSLLPQAPLVRSVANPRPSAERLHRAEPQLTCSTLLLHTLRLQGTAVSAAGRTAMENSNSLREVPRGCGCRAVRMAVHNFWHLVYFFKMLKQPQNKPRLTFQRTRKV